MKKISILITLGYYLFANSLTIYNNNLAFFFETRDLNVSNGLQEITLANLPKSVIADSVNPVFSDDIVLNSFSFNNNQITINKLLEANLNSEVTFLTKDKKYLKGVLLSLSPVIVKSNNRYYSVDSKDIIFSKFPSNIDLKPSLTLNLKSKKNKESQVKLYYLLEGLNWYSSYNLFLTKKSLNLKMLATITNRCGKDFNSINLALVAGELNTLKSAVMPKRGYKVKAAVALEASSPVQIAPKSLSSYYIYNLPRKTTLLNNQTKQILLYEANSIPFKRFAVAKNSYFYNYGEQKLEFLQEIEFNNTKSEGLGLPMPGGIARVYTMGRYLGDSNIKNIPKNEKIKLSIGKFFDIVGKKKIVKYITREGYKDIVTKYIIKNRSSSSVVIKLEENRPHSKRRVEYKSSCSGVCTKKDKNAFTKEYRVKLNPNSSYEFTTEYEVYY